MRARLVVGVVVLGLLGAIDLSALAYSHTSPPGEGTVVSVRLFEWGISLSPREVPAGAVRFVVANRGAVGHAFALVGPGVSQETRVLRPGGDATVTVELAPGTYAIWCPVPGHRELGMETPLRVIPVQPPEEGEGGSPLKRFDLNNNDLIDDPEFFAIIDAWVAGELDDATFFLAIDLWVIRRPISSISMGSQGQGERARFALGVHPRRGEIVFAVRGAREIVSLRVEIYSLTGQRVFARTASSSQLIWNLSTLEGQPIANGVYLHRVIAWGSDGTVWQSGIRKLAVLR